MSYFLKKILITPSFFLYKVEGGMNPITNYELRITGYSGRDFESHPELIPSLLVINTSYKKRLMLPSGEMGDQKRGGCSAPLLFLFPNKREDKLLGKQ